MIEISYSPYDKSDWGEGPWQNEPDKIQWEDKDTGLPCLIVRNHFGSLCGYVGVFEGPLYGTDYSELYHLNVHGGLTYSAFCNDEDDPWRSICHIDDESDHVKMWWLGFDCNHHMDYAPRYPILLRGVKTTYRDLEFVKAQCEKLAKQIKEF